MKLHCDYSDARAQAAAKVKYNVFRTAISYTLGSAVNAITFTTDDDGNALNAKKAKLTLVIPAGCSAPTGSSALIYGKISNISTGYKDPSGSTDNGVQAMCGAIRNVWAQIIIDFDIINGAALTTKAFYAYSDGTSRTTGVMQSGLTSGISAITKFYFYLSGSYTLPAGTVIIVEVVDV